VTVTVKMQLTVQSRLLKYFIKLPELLNLSIIHNIWKSII